MTANSRYKSKAALLHWINMVSFAADDAALYLDTHPQDQGALAYFANYSGLRRQAMEDFAEAFYPLTRDASQNSRQQWDWGAGPLPWEGGC